MAQNGEPTLRERKRSETRRRIADEAVRLASAKGIAATTADEIARGAGVGRATFFRYFDSKELAIAAGLSDVAVFVLATVLAELPDDLGPLDAVRAAHAVLGEDFEANRQMFLDQALLTRSSPAMLAWSLYLYVDWEVAIADAVQLSRHRAPTVLSCRPLSARPARRSLPRRGRCL
jgi:AcrR family transcriptional regulator